MQHACKYYYETIDKYRFKVRGTRCEDGEARTEEIKNAGSRRIEVRTFPLSLDPRTSTLFLKEVG